MKPNPNLAFARSVLSSAGDERLAAITADELARSSGCTIAEAETEIRIERTRRAR